MAAMIPLPRLPTDGTAAGDDWFRIGRMKLDAESGGGGRGLRTRSGRPLRRRVQVGAATLATSVYVAVTSMIAGGLFVPLPTLPVLNEVPKPDAAHRARPLDPEHGPGLGKISYYAHRLAGRPTASGESFDPEALTMAHPTLPFGTLVKVTSLRNQRSVVLTVNDRGPFTGARIADVSPAAARLLGMIRAGLVTARIEVLDPVLSPAAGSRQAPSRPAR